MKCMLKQHLSGDKKETSPNIYYYSNAMNNQVNQSQVPYTNVSYRDGSTAMKMP